MDDMGTPGPNHPANIGLRKNSNVVQLPMSKRTKMRIALNKAKDKIGVKPEQVTYQTPFTPEIQPTAGALDDHIRQSQSTSEYHDMLPKSDHFENGQQEAKVISMGKWKENRDANRLMEGNDE